MNKLELLKDLSGSFITKERTNGDKFVCFKDDAPQEYSDLIMELCGGQISSMDFAYRSARDLIYMIIDSVEYGSDQDLEDLEIDIEPDIYNYNLIKWLADDLYNIELVNEVLRELEFNDLISAIQYAQVMELESYTSAIIGFINNNSEDD